MVTLDYFSCALPLLAGPKATKGRFKKTTHTGVREYDFFMSVYNFIITVYDSIIQFTTLLFLYT